MKPRNAMTRAYRRRSAPRPTPTRRASQVSQSGKTTDAAATATKPTRRIRRIAWWRAFAVVRVSSAATTPTPTSRRTWMTIWSDMGLRSAEDEVDEDVHRVEQRLPRGAGVVGVEQVHRVLGPR